MRERLWIVQRHHSNHQERAGRQALVVAAVAPGAAVSAANARGTAAPRRTNPLLKPPAHLHPSAPQRTVIFLPLAQSYITGEGSGVAIAGSRRADVTGTRGEGTNWLNFSKAVVSKGALTYLTA